MEHTFNSTRLLSPIFPDAIKMHEKGISVIIRKLFSSDETFIFFSDVSGIEVKKGVFFADILIRPRMQEPILVKNFGKKDADEIKELLLANVKDSN